MPYNDRLANRIRRFLRSNSMMREPGSIHPLLKPIFSNMNGTRVEERQLFGGLAFLVNGIMAFAVVRDDILIRADPESNYKSDSPMNRLYSSDGKPIHGWTLISKAHHKPEAVLSQWINLGIQNTFLAEHASDFSRNLNEAHS